MKQSRMTSLFKSLVSTAVGFGVAYVANMLILPLFGLPISHSANLILTSIYTGISIARGYALERVFEALGWRQRISPFMSAVIAERQRQQDVEGWDVHHDDEHLRGELARAGAAYAMGAAGPKTFAFKSIWPWDEAWWKPGDFRRDLVKGCALIVAEGEKFDRTRKSRRDSSATMMGRTNDARPSLMTTNKIALEVMTVERAIKRIVELDAEIKAYPHWGAALTAMDEERKGLVRFVARNTHSISHDPTPREQGGASA